MERVAFLVEATGERLSCLLNPEGIVWRRQAGLRRRGTATGVITGQALADDPLIATGGGSTEIDLDLLFDIELAGGLMPAASPLASAGDAADRRPDETDVRDMTRTFWNLAENGASQDGFGAPPLVRLIWGRAWNIPGLVIAVAERLERFTASGVPQRSWLRLRLSRVAEGEAGATVSAPVTPQFEPPVLPDGDDAAVPWLDLPIDADGLPQRRFDQIAADATGNPASWRSLAELNDIDDPLQLPEGVVLRLPSATRTRLA